MAVNEGQLFRPRKRLRWWLALAWFVFVNVVFYVNLLQQRFTELPLLWERLMQVLR